MAQVHATPGVYIEEKSAFPNSAVPVATAVPAFIGYTEKAIRNKTSVKYKPTKISSFGEYLIYFGAGPESTYRVNDISAQDPKQLYEVEAVARTRFLLFYSMKLFFANGGADCYIVSVGSYEEHKSLDALAAGLPPLLKEPEPTMVVIPDAVLLEESECYTLQKQMLLHCGGKMRNRMSILDVYNGFEKLTPGENDVITKFRAGIGDNYLDFGAAYYPWVDTTITGSESVDLFNVDSKSRETFMNLLKKEVDLNIQQGLLAQKRGTLIQGEINKIPDAVIHDARGEVFTGIKESHDLLERFVVDNPTADILAAVQALDPAATPQQIKNELAALGLLIDKVKVWDEAIAAFNEFGTKTDGTIAAVGKHSNISTSFPDSDPIHLGKKLQRLLVIDTSSKARAEAGLTALAGLSQEDIQDLVKKAADALKTRVDRKALHQALWAISPLYKAILTTIREQINLLPPSGGMAGIYTMIDSSVGVFQSPANVSILSVIKPAVDLTNEEQEDLNIPLNGKAVNAIRSFPGKGVLVWGARTLDGNSQDWRYISVRRTMIFIEQSIKYAAEAYVFEPNTAATWTNVKAMITNFLTNVWQGGALAGATPEDAFSVDVGLGVTMTPVDILDGIMRITVKVAVTRPAEFIVLTFQQKMQQS